MSFVLQLFVSDGTTLHSLLDKPSLPQRRAVQWTGILHRSIKNPLVEFCTLVFYISNNVSNSNYYKVLNWSSVLIVALSQSNSPSIFPWKTMHKFLQYRQIKVHVVLPHSCNLQFCACDRCSKSTAMTKTNLPSVNIMEMDTANHSPTVITNAHQNTNPVIKTALEIFNYCKTFPLEPKTLLSPSCSHNPFESLQVFPD